MWSRFNGTNAKRFPSPLFNQRRKLRYAIACTYYNNINHNWKYSYTSFTHCGYTSKDARLFPADINIIIYYRLLQSCLGTHNNVNVFTRLILLPLYIAQQCALYIIYIQYLFNMSNASLWRFETLRSGVQPYNNIGILPIGSRYYNILWDKTKLDSISFIISLWL